jgi:thymidylate synthase (FAD)
VLEHYSFTAKFVCDRGVSHEIVRHRIASYSQESTRYCNYSKDGFGNEITVILPCFFDTGMGTLSNSLVYEEWKIACERAERSYFKLLDMGATPQEARSALPNSLKTELVMTANLREWRHFLRLRTSPAAHHQMREVALMLLEQVREKVPVVFEDIEA